MKGGKVKIFVEVVLVVLLVPFAFDGLTTLRQIEYDQTAPNVVTAAVTTDDVTLTKALFNDDVVYVTAISSSNATDTPVATTYTTGTKALTVDGLVENATRTLTITYGYQRFDDSLDSIVAFIPTGLILLLLYLIITGLWHK